MKLMELLIQSWPLKAISVRVSWSIRMAMAYLCGELDLLPAVPGAPAVDGIGGEFADPHQVGPQKIGGLLDVAGHPLRGPRASGPSWGHRTVHDLRR